MVNDTDSTFSLDLIIIILAVRGVRLSMPRSLLNTPRAQNLTRISTVEYLGTPYCLQTGASDRCY
jgi:hypothetical protein